MDGCRLTPEIICSGLRIIQAGYEREGVDFNIVSAEGEYGKGQHRIDVSFCRLLSEAIELLKEQDAVHWTKCSEKLPSADGDYLVIKSIMGIYDKIDVCGFTLNLHDLDEFDFPDEDRPGWYECDSETGYFEWTGIKYWSELPKMPYVGQ